MRKLLCVGIVMVAASCVAQAYVFYNDYSTWSTNVSGITTVNFEGIAGVNSFANVTPGTTVGGVTFAIGPAAPSGSALFVIGDNFYGYGYAVIASQAASGTLDLQVTMPSPVTAVGFDYIVGP